MNSVIKELSQLCHDYSLFWMKETQNFTSYVEILKATARNLNVLNITVQPYDPNHDLKLSVFQSMERIFADRIAPLVKRLSNLAQRATKIVQEIDRLIYKNKEVDAPTVFGRNFPNVYPALENIYYSISAATTRVIDAVDNLNYTDVETFKPLNDAIMSAFASIEELNGVMVRINAITKEGEAEI